MRNIPPRQSRGQFINAILMNTGMRTARELAEDPRYGSWMGTDGPDKYKNWSAALTKAHQDGDICAFNPKGQPTVYFSNVAALFEMVQRLEKLLNEHRSPVV